MMKQLRISALVLAGALSLSLLTACGGKEETPAPSEAPAVTESAAPAEPETPEVSALPEEVLPEEEFPMESEAPIDDPVIAAFWKNLTDASEMPALMDLDAEMLKAMYNIDAADLDSYLCKMPMMNTQATEFFMAKVKPEKMESVKASVMERQAALVEQWKTYLPEQLELVENYKLLTSGDYLLFAVSYEPDQVETVFNDSTK